MGKINRGRNGTMRLPGDRTRPLEIDGVDRREDGERFCWVEETIMTKVTTLPGFWALLVGELCRGRRFVMTVTVQKEVEVVCLFISLFLFLSIHPFVDISISTCMYIYIGEGWAEGEVWWGPGYPTEKDISIYFIARIGFSMQSFKKWITLLPMAGVWGPDAQTEDRCFPIKYRRDFGWNHL